MTSHASNSDDSSEDEWMYENHGLTLSDSKQKRFSNLEAGKNEESRDQNCKLEAGKNEEAFDQNEELIEQKANANACIAKKMNFIDLSDETADDQEVVGVPSVETRMEQLNLDKSGTSKDKTEKNKSAWSHDDEIDEYYLSSALVEIKGVTWPYFSIPSKLYNSLYPHQRVGVQWMASMHSSKIGGILADDMGLGKTWQTLTYIAGLMRAKILSTALVIAPTSILRTWEKEALKVICDYASLPDLRIHVVSSSLKRADRQRILRATLNRNKNKTPYLIISSYGLVSNNPEDFVVGTQGFDYVILDEAHRIKNNATKMFFGCQRVCKNDNTRRLLLTGTPIQNNLKEMWTLFDFATSGSLLGTLKIFMRDFGDPIELGRNKHATQLTMEQAKKANTSLQNLLKPNFLQRMKIDVLPDMPPKYDFVIWTHISAEQRRMYRDYVSSSDVVRSVLTGEKRSPLEALTWLKKLAGHPLLVDTNYDREWSTLCKIPSTELLEQSGKLKILVSLVHKLSASGHRTLIFSGSTKILDIIQRVLHGLKISRIDGSTKEVDRQRNVEAFNKENSRISVMLLSTKAGGLGLTLTGADRAVIYDPSWNPTDDSQAVDRCYRIGQRRPVEVYRFIAAGTVEEKMYEKQIFKDGIRRVVTTSLGSNTDRHFDKYEVGKLFFLSPPGESPVLQKLQEQNRIGNVNNTTQMKFFDEHEDVIGLSSHDAVYKEGADTYHSNKNEAPFSGKTRVTAHRLIGKSQRAMQVFGPPKVLRKRLLKRSENIPSSVENKYPHKATMSGVVTFKENDFDALKKSVKYLRKKNRNEEALDYLLVSIEENKELTKMQKLWLHKQCSEVSTNLGWL